MKRSSGNSIWPTARSPTGPANVIAATPDGRLLVAQTSFGTLHVEDAATGRRIYEAKAYAARATIAPNGRHLATSRDRSVAVWSLESVALDWSAESTGTLHALAFSPDGNTLAAVGADNIVHVWDMRANLVGRSFGGHGAEIRALAFQPDGKRLASADRFGELKVWDFDRDPPGTRFHAGLCGDSIGAIALTPDGSRAFVAERHCSQIWGIDVADRTERVHRNPQFVDTVRYPRNDYTFDGTATTFAARCKERIDVVGVSSMADGHEIARLIGLTAPVAGVALTPDGRFAAASGNNGVERHGRRETVDGKVMRWDVATGRALAPSLDIGARTLALSADGTRLAAFSASGRLSVFDADGHELWAAADYGRFRRTAGTAYVFGLAFSPDGRMLASTNYHQGTLTLFDGATGRVLHRLVDRQWLVGVAFSPDGRRVAVNAYDGEVRLWDTATGTALLALRGRGARQEANIGYSTRVAFSADGNRIVANDWTANISVWVGRPTDP